jgi:hypothetical protein
LQVAWAGEAKVGEARQLRLLFTIRYSRFWGAIFDVLWVVGGKNQPERVSVRFLGGEEGDGQLAVGSWQLAVGSWQWAVGSWQLAVGSGK